VMATTRNLRCRPGATQRILNLMIEVPLATAGCG
jgi:hypothetical protein